MYPQNVEYTTSDKVRIEMALNHHTRTHLAKELNISRYTLARKLSNEFPWTVSELKKLEEIYNKPRAYFF
jgi:uncharacterized protein YidB (DUF937 family)